MRGMRLRIRSFRRLVILALPCWLVGGPLAATLQGLASCPHDQAMRGPMHHNGGSEAPCWCPDMGGPGAVELPTVPAASPEPATMLATAPIWTEAAAVGSIPLPTSPSFAPTPPPPNQL